MAHTELNLRERRAIEDMLNAKVPVSKIATEIGRHRSTIYREIKRNGFEDNELPLSNTKMNKSYENTRKCLFNQYVCSNASYPRRETAG